MTDQITYDSKVVFKYELHVLNETTVEQTVVITDHRDFYHSIKQRIVANQTSWYQLLTYEGDNMLEFSQAEDDGLKVRNADLAEDLQLV